MCSTNNFDKLLKTNDLSFCQTFALCIYVVIGCILFCAIRAKATL